MRAAQINEYGDTSIIQVKDIERPAAHEGQVLVEVYASSINPIDTMLRTGQVQAMIPLTFPVTMGGDFAGIIADVGDGVVGFAVGDRVYGQANARHGDSGAFAEFAVTTVEQLAKAPQNSTFNEAASLPMVGVSALQALTEHIQLKHGQKILITGGSGGIGTIAIQLAKHIGAYVTATTTGDTIGAVTQLGADSVIDYSTQQISEVIKGYDAVFNTASGGDLDDALRALRSGGVAVSMAAQPSSELASKLEITVMRQGTQITTKRLTELARLVEEGVVRPQVARVFSLNDAQEAFRVKEDEKVTGKIVIEIKKE